MEFFHTVYLLGFHVHREHPEDQVVQVFALNQASLNHQADEQLHSPVDEEPVGLREVLGRQLVVLKVLRRRPSWLLDLVDLSQQFESFKTRLFSI